MKKGLHTPWSDVCDLLFYADKQEDNGYGVDEPTKTTVFCNFEDDVSQSEFYLSMKAGLRASAQIQIWKADYAAAFPAGTAGECFVDFAGRHFKVLRDFPQDFDTQTLILTEVIR